MMRERNVLGRSLFQLGIGACVAGSVMLHSSAAFAGIALSVGPNYPGTVAVNETDILVSLTITNASADDAGSPGVDSNRNLTVDNVFHTPACDLSALMCPAGARELGLFEVVGPATGSGGMAGCDGTWTFSAPDASGEVQFFPPGGEGTLVLGPASGTLASRQCTVVFKVNVLRLPSNDANPGMVGLQTIQLGRGIAHFSDNPLITGTGGGSDIVTVVGGMLIPPPPAEAPAMSSSLLVGTGVLMLLWVVRRTRRRTPTA